MAFLTICSNPAIAQSGKVIDMSSADGITVAVTDAGEILRSVGDSPEWTTFRFNEEYSDFYQKINLIGIAAGGGQIAVVGTDPQGLPAAFFSTEGKVWSPRELTAKGYGRLEAVPEGIEYDPEHDRMVIRCEGGVLFYLPACSHCNSVEITQEI